MPRSHATLLAAVIALVMGGCSSAASPSPSGSADLRGSGSPAVLTPPPTPVVPATPTGAPSPTPIAASPLETTAWATATSRPVPALDRTSIEAVTEAIVQGFRDGDASRLADLMRSPFVIGYWASEGFEREPLIAARLLLDEAGPDGTVELRMHADPATVVGPAWEDMFGPTVDVEAGFVLDGWGDDDRGAAVAYLTRMPDGRLVWHGIVINRLGEA